MVTIARPMRSGLGWVVNLDKGHFTGRKALLAEAFQTGDDGDSRNSLSTETNRSAQAFIFNRKNGKQVGEIKCASWSPILKANLALADLEYVDGRQPSKLWARIDYQRELKWLSTWAECHVQSKPFYNPEHRSATPPARF